MKLTFLQLVGGYNAMKEIIAEKKQLPIKLSLAIARNIRLIEPEIKTFEKAQLEIFKEFGKPIPPTKDLPERYNFEGESRVLAEKKLEELYNTEIELLVQQVNISDAGETFQADQMLSLEWMFIE